MGCNTKSCRAICLGTQPVDPSGVATGPNRRRELPTGSKEDPKRDFNADLQGRRHDPILFSRLQAEDAMTHCKHGTTLGTLRPSPTVAHRTVAHCIVTSAALSSCCAAATPRSSAAASGFESEQQRGGADPRASSSRHDSSCRAKRGSLHATDPASRDADVVLSAYQADWGLLGSPAGHGCAADPAMP